MKLDDQYFQERFDDLNKQREQLQTNLIAVQGMLQEVQHAFKKFKEDEEKQKKGKK